MLLLTRTTPAEDCAQRTDGLTLFVARLRDPAVSIRPIPKVGRNAVASCEVRYDDLYVDAADRVGEEGQGFRYLLDGLNAERILLAAEALGIGRAALRRAVAYAKEPDRLRPADRRRTRASRSRSPRRTPGSHAAELAIRAGGLARSTATCRAASRPTWPSSSPADAGFAAADAAVQTHGGFGYAREYHVERYWREARLMRIAPVPQEMVLNYLAEHVLGLPRSY